MRFFDANCMLGPNISPKLPIETAAALLALMDDYGIERAVVYHSAARFYHPREGNDALLREIGPHKGRLLPCLVLLPTTTGETGSIRKVKRLLDESEAVAVRFFPTEHNFCLDEWCVGDLLSLLEERSIPLILEHGQQGIGEIRAICERHPNLPVILSVTGYRTTRTLYALFRDCPNFHIEISTFLVFRGLEDVVRRFGPGKLLFGTRVPHQPPGAAMARILYAEIDEKAKKAIAFDNARRLFEGR